jgi:predicted PurR-regulated permease PerM
MSDDPSPSVMTWLAIVVITCCILFFFQKVLWLVVPVLSALVLYYCLRPLVQALVRSGLKHRTAVKAVAGILFLETVLAVVLLWSLAGSRSAAWTKAAEDNLQGGLDFIRQAGMAISRRFPALEPAITRSSPGSVQLIASQFGEKYLGVLFVQIVHWLPSLLLMPYLTYFFLQDGNRFKKELIRSVPNAFFEKTLLLFERVDKSLQSLFVGLMKLTFLDTACLATGLWLLGVSFPLLLGLLSAVLAWVPYVGSAMGCILVICVAATDFPGQPMKIYGCILLFLGARVLDDFVFLPLTVGRSLRLHPVLSVLMLFLGAAVAGPTGLVLVLPVLGVVAVIVETMLQIVTDQRLRMRFRNARQLKLGLRLDST